MCEYCENGKNIELTSDSAKVIGLLSAEMELQGSIVKWAKTN